MKQVLARLSFTVCCTLPTLYAESALQQLYVAGGSPPEVPMPQLKTESYSGTKSSVPSSTSRSSTTKTSSRTPSPSATIGATLFGAVLESVLFDAPNEPDPETVRQQQEQQRLEEETAKQQEQEANKHHQNLMHSFKSVPSTTTTTETTLSSSGLAFKTTTKVPIDIHSYEAMRESASRPFDGGGSYTALPATWKPYPLGKAPISFSKASTLCQNKQCSWPKATPLNTTLPKATVRHTPINLSSLGTPTTPNPGMLLKTILASKQDDTNSFFVILNRLSYLGKEVGKELLTSIAMKLLESTPAGEKLALIKEVHDLANNDMEDANKVALWLGSSRIDQPPEITSLADDAKPFLIRGISAQESYEKLAEVVSDTNEIFDMSEKFSNILKNMP